MHLRTWLEISEQALYHNICQIKQIIGPTQLGLVVKANAYGHGLIEIGQLADKHPDVAWFFTAGISEALQLRRVGIKKPIVALICYGECIQAALENQIDIAVYDEAILQAISECAQRLGIVARVHIEVDSGMSRLGFKPVDVCAMMRDRCLYPFVNFYGIFTHLSDTNNTDLTFTEQQVSVFDELIKRLESEHVYFPYPHIFSSGSLFFPQKYPLVRVGTNVYGFWKSKIQQERFEKYFPGIFLKPVLTWKTKIMSLQYVDQGAAVGYNKTFVVDRPSVLAILPVGYVDGYGRMLSNSVSVMIRNKKAPVVGLISMNLTIVDVTDIADVQRDDEVILLTDVEGLTATDLALAVKTINNEFVTRLPESLPRRCVS